MDLDLGMLLLRLALGLTLVIHGWNKVAGAGGIAGTTRWFEGLGLRPAWLHARLAAATELGAGMLVALGLLSGLGATAFVGLMAVAALTDHRGKGYFVFKGGNEYTVFIAATAVALAAIGPGAWSLDRVLSLRLYGVGWAVGAFLGGCAAAALLLTSSYRPRPKPGEAG
ncbi:DoxX family protein [Actinospica sp.]|jgi:putative oxidoreductase|uniref:DoxX family protein n=1 Tax=Actinospica sp. TaxID=1872142 RepID=UPI002CD374F3|nr:DoxX family protein [Actinospica sp.]HWG23280.1 DoxX family protein [Actinospica sp.]